MSTVSARSARARVVNNSRRSRTSAEGRLIRPEDGPVAGPRRRFLGFAICLAGDQPRVLVGVGMGKDDDPEARSLTRGGRPKLVASAGLRARLKPGASSGTDREIGREPEIRRRRKS